MDDIGPSQGTYQQRRAFPLEDEPRCGLVSEDFIDGVGERTSPQGDRMTVVTELTLGSRETLRVSSYRVRDVEDPEAPHDHSRR